MTERSNGQRPTPEDVARRAGVSKSTVSRVINGEPRVRAAVAERIRQAVAELGYVPNQAARSLVTRRNNAVAVVVTEPQNRLFVDPYFDCHLRGIRHELVQQGAQPVLLFIEEPDDYPRVGNFLGGGHVDGATVSPTVPGRHAGAAGGLHPVPDGAAKDPRSAGRSRPAPYEARQHRGRQGIQQRPVPRMPAAPRHPAHDPGEDRQPGRPATRRLTRRKATRLRRRAVQEARHRLTNDQQTDQSRAVATRHDKRGYIFLSTATIAALLIWLRS